MTQACEPLCNWQAQMYAHCRITGIYSTSGILSRVSLYINGYSRRMRTCSLPIGRNRTARKCGMDCEFYHSSERSAFIVADRRVPEPIGMMLRERCERFRIGDQRLTAFETVMLIRWLSRQADRREVAISCRCIRRLSLSGLPAACHAVHRSC